jgi:hypothetical protein
MLRRSFRSIVMVPLLLAASLGIVHAQPRMPVDKQDLADFLLEYMEVRYPGVDVDGDVLYVSVRSQTMYHVRGRRMLREFVISTSAKGLGEREDSYRTPTGLHWISERIGEGLPAWSVLREREATGELADSCTTRSQDLVTSRILWLSGMEPGHNQGGPVDSHDRWIYIHGTADECSLGTPSSHGCIRMANRDVIELFDQLPVGTLVVIYDN